MADLFCSHEISSFHFISFHSSLTRSVTQFACLQLLNQSARTSCATLQISNLAMPLRFMKAYGVDALCKFFFFLIEFSEFFALPFSSIFEQADLRRRGRGDCRRRSVTEQLSVFLCSGCAILFCDGLSLHRV